VKELLKSDSICQSYVQIKKVQFFWLGVYIHIWTVYLCASVPADLIVSVIFVKAQFIGPNQFCRYNMFNHYFFGGEASRSVYLRFLRKCSSHSADDILVVIDPPFGGHVAVIAFVLQCISDDYKNVHQGIDAILWQ